MPALNYKEQFAPKILDGSKIHTIRRMRKRPFKVGDRLYHFTGQRTKSCQRLRENICSYAYDIKIEYTILGQFIGVMISLFNNDMQYILHTGFMKKIAINDGFKSYKEFERFFIDSGLPLHGQLIGWTKYPGYGGIK
jgi:hypothetical protein